MAAMLEATVPVSSLERSMALMIRGWCAYATAHADTFDTKVGDDHILGDAWSVVGQGLRTLLNGELGRLDAVTLDTLIGDNLKGQGFDLNKRSET